MKQIGLNHLVPEDEYSLEAYHTHKYFIMESN